MSLYHERGGNSHNFNSAPQIARLPISPLPPMRVDQIRTEPYLLRNPKSKPLPSDISSFESHLKHLTPKQKKALATALIVTSIGLGLATDSNIAHAAATDCGRDWFDTCLCNGQVVDGDKYCPRGSEQSKQTLPDPASEQNRTGINREIGGSTAAVLVSGVLILAALGGLYIVNNLNKDMPN